MAVLGLMLGLVGSVVVAGRTTVGTVTLPWGLVLMLTAVVVLVRAIVWQSGTRATGLALMGGWFAATSAVLVYAPGSDVLLPDLTRSWVYVVGATILGLGAALWPLPAGLADLIAEEQRTVEHVPGPLDVLPGAAGLPVPPDAGPGPSGDAAPGR
jgi:hypothetical protein